MFGMNWLKPLIKKRMNPVAPEVARKRIHNLSMTYAFLGWNFVAFLLYLTWKKAIPEGPDKIKKYAEILDVDHAHVIKYSGFTKVEDYELDRREEISKDPKKRRQQITDLDV